MVAARTNTAGQTQRIGDGRVAGIGNDHSAEIDRGASVANDQDPLIDATTATEEGREVGQGVVSARTKGPKRTSSLGVEILVVGRPHGLHPVPQTAIPPSTGSLNRSTKTGLSPPLIIVLAKETTVAADEEEVGGVEAWTVGEAVSTEGAVDLKVDVVGSKETVVDLTADAVESKVGVVASIVDEVDSRVGAVDS